MRGGKYGPGALTGKGWKWVGLKVGNFNAEFIQPTRFNGNAFVPWIGGDLDDILRERFERIVGCDNCVSPCCRTHNEKSHPEGGFLRV
jgi:hypothetical protein